MASLDRVPPPPDITSTIGGSVGRSLKGGFGGTVPVLARGGAGVQAQLYGLSPDELLKQPLIALGTGAIPHADFGVRTPEDLAGLRADLIERLQPRLPRGTT